MTPVVKTMDVEAAGIATKQVPMTLMKAPTVKDHTAIVNLVMENPQQFARALGARELAKSKARFSRVQVLDALLAMPQIPAARRRKLEVAKHFAAQMERAKLEIPAAKRKALERLFAETRAVHSVHGKVAVVRRLLKDPELVGQKDLATALEFGIELLEDGASTIYSAKHPFYRQISSPRVEPQGGTGSSWGPDDPPGAGGGTGGGKPNDDVGQADFEGGVEGSFGGYMVGSTVSPPGTESVGGEVGAAVGGAAGAIGSSAAAIGRKFVNWLF